MNRTLTPESSISAISPADAQQKRVEALLLDVRTPAEFEEAHIEGSILLPLGDLNPEEVKRLATGKSACVLVCRSGNRARQAA
jgi:rhodanese-related sulfurtransferase